MNPVEHHDGWMSLSGGRRKPSRVATVAHAPSDAKTEEPQPEERLAPLASERDANSGRISPRLDHGRWTRFARRWTGRRIGNRPQAKATLTMGPIDWIETLRGMIVLGMLGGVLWLEWIVIKAIATYVSSLL